MLALQVHCQAGNLTQSFVDYQKLSKLMPNKADVFEKLQQAARLCLGCQSESGQVSNDLSFVQMLTDPVEHGTDKSSRILTANGDCPWAE